MKEGTSVERGEGTRNGRKEEERIEKRSERLKEIGK